MDVKTQGTRLRDVRRSHRPCRSAAFARGHPQSARRIVRTHTHTYNALAPFEACVSEVVLPKFGSKPLNRSTEPRKTELNRSFGLPAPTVRLLPKLYSCRLQPAQPTNRCQIRCQQGHSLLLCDPAASLTSRAMSSPSLRWFNVLRCPYGL